MKYLLTILGLFYTTVTIACRCRELPPLDDAQYESYGGIITGKVIVSEKSDGWINYIVQIIKIYKGSFTTTRITVASQYNSCVIDLKVGHDYIIYGSAYPNQINTNMCSRTICLSNDYRNVSKEIKDQTQLRIKTDLDFLEKKLK